MSNKQHTPEPFGFFKAEPFGWTDCAETDEGAQPLFDQAAIDAISKQRDELLAAAELLLSRRRPGEKEGDPRLILEIDCMNLEDAIASVKGGAAQAVSQVLNIDPTGIERDCCGTFFRSPHRSTCKKYRGKKGGAA